MKVVEWAVSKVEMLEVLWAVSKVVSMGKNWVDLMEPSMD